MSTTDPRRLWRLKLAARTHDPAEKALVLLRDPVGHEGGTVRAIQRIAGLERVTDTITLDADESPIGAAALPDGLSATDYELVRRADHWASAADRPQFPLEEITVPTREGGQKRVFGYVKWSRVNWARHPVLRHPLGDDKLDLGLLEGGLRNVTPDAVKQRSIAQFERLLHRGEDGSVDQRRTALALWRFGPELGDEDTADEARLGALWSLLPADTRIPDHTIWDHLDMVSAFTGAFAADPDGEVALLSVSIGPVQPFIEAARTTSDLWAGSHLLARIVWETIRPVVDALGPDAVLFPRLRGVPQVDLWLRDRCDLRESLFEDCDWQRSGTDANPLFSAALPNRFVALVPASQVTMLAEAAEKAARDWVQGLGQRVVTRLLEEIGRSQDPELPCREQAREQLAGFPEVQWSAVPFSLIGAERTRERRALDTTLLAAAMRPFFGTDQSEAPGFLGSEAWRVLQPGIEWQDGTRFFAPNPGTLYPALHDLVERALAATKTLRPFAPLAQEGWRCSLTGESEWLTTDRAQLATRSSRQDTTEMGAETLWTLIAERRPAWARTGERLGALAATKRLWPTLFAEEVAEALGQSEIDRFVVSTHTMALASSLQAWQQQGCEVVEGWDEQIAEAQVPRVALPSRLVRHLAGTGDSGRRRQRRMSELAGLLERADESDDETLARRWRTSARRSLEKAGLPAPETYYALLLFDGDRMGEWLAADSRFAATYIDSFHPIVSEGFGKRARENPRLRDYANTRRALSPGRHLAISGALQDFSMHVARHVIETEYGGRLLYAGGDDVMAMLPADELLGAAHRLRNAYSGRGDEREGRPPASSTTSGTSASVDTMPRLHCANGFAVLERGSRTRVLRMMGNKASGSAGLVIAHHKTPLGAVLRELRASERRAKERGGRDAFSLTLLKRSGGSLGLTAKWGKSLVLLLELRDFLREPVVSRRAAYLVSAWLDDLPMDNPGLLRTLLRAQLLRQTQVAGTEDAMHQRIDDLARCLCELAFDPEFVGSNSADRARQLTEFVGVAEFLARETRGGASS